MRLFYLIYFVFVTWVLQSCAGQVGNFAGGKNPGSTSTTKTSGADATGTTQTAKTGGPASSVPSRSQPNVAPKYSLMIPITPFSNMASGYQATNPGFRAILKDSGGNVIAAGPMSIDAAMNGTQDDASQGSAYGRLVLNVNLAYVDSRYADTQGDGAGTLSICMAQAPGASFDQSGCKNLSGNMHPDRPFQYLDMKVLFKTGDHKISITRFDGDTGEGGTSQQIALAVYHPAFGFAAPGKAFKDYQSPLVLDWNRDGKINLTDVWDIKNTVLFDLLGNGKKVTTGWIGKGDAFLALDTDGSGVIDSGRKLFGEHSATVDGTQKQFDNGFLALAQYDENHDGVIDAKDPIFSKLLIWRDTNHNGKSESSELVRLADTDVVSISLAYETVKDTTGVVRVLDNEIRVRSEYQTKSGAKFSIVDVWFKQRTLNPVAFLED